MLERFSARGRLCVLILLFSAPAAAMAQGLSAEDLGDLEANGQVDSADVLRALRIVAGDQGAEATDLRRGNLAPATIAEPGHSPELLRSNPRAGSGGEASLDLGDAVLICRRAAGTIEFVPPNQPPEVTLDPVPATVNRPQLTLEGHVEDESPTEAVVRIFLDGAEVATATPTPTGAFLVTITLADGAQVVSAQAEDVFEVPGAVSDPWTVVLDTAPPLLSVASPADGAVLAAAEVEISGEALDPAGIAEVRIEGPGGGIDAVLIPNATGALFGGNLGLVPGENLISITARDAAGDGNTSPPLTLTLIHDPDPPVLLIDPVTSPTGSQRIVVTGVASDAFGVVEVSVNGVVATLEDPVTGAFRVELPLVEGDNTLIAEATDRAGNVGQSPPVLLVADFTPPSVTLLSSPWVSASPTDLVLEFDEPVRLLSLAGQNLAPPLALPAGAASFEDIALQPGENLLRVVAEDLAGNGSDVSVSVTLDSDPPLLAITDIEHASAAVLRNGPEPTTAAGSVTVVGTVSDALSGVQGVVVNGRQATVAEDGSFRAAGVSLLPGMNTLVAEATDRAGNTASADGRAYRDVAGPRMELSVSRPSYVSNAAPALAGTLDGRTDVQLSVDANDVRTSVAGVAATLDGAALPVTGSGSSYSFTLPAAALSQSGMRVLEVAATDTLGNISVTTRAMPTGRFVAPGQQIEGALGLGLGVTAFSILEDLVEGEMEAFAGNEFGGVSTSVAGFDFEVLGVAFCDPPNRGAGPSSNPTPPQSAYGCTNDVEVTLSAAPTHLEFEIVVPRLFVDVRTRGANFLTRLVCGSSWRGGWMVFGRQQPVRITLQANFVNTSNGPELRAVPGGTSVDLGPDSNAELQFSSTCVSLGVALLRGFVLSTIQSQLADQADSLLAGFASFLSDPLFERPETNFALEITEMSNTPDGIAIWLGVRGDPQGGVLADPAVPRAPGTLMGTPNPTFASRVDIDFRDPAGQLVSMEVALGDEYLNYLFLSAWGQGMLNLEVDGDLTGGTLPLDTNTFGVFAPGLNTRPDVLAQVPAGTPMGVSLRPQAPFLASYDPAQPAGQRPLRLDVPELLIDFRADTNGDADQESGNGYETLLFTAAFHLRLDVGMDFVAAPDRASSDHLAIDISVADESVEVIANPFQLVEGELRAALPSFVNLLLPIAAQLAGEVALPGSGFRFESLQDSGPQADYLVFSGNLQHDVAIDAPVDGTLTDARRVDFAGTAIELTASPVNADVELYLNGQRVANSRVNRSTNNGAGTIAISADDLVLDEGENEIRLVVADNRNQRPSGGARFSYAAVTVTYDPDAGGTTVVPSGCACDATETAGSLDLALLPWLAALLLLRRRRRELGIALCAAAFLTLAACSETNTQSRFQPDAGGPGAPDAGSDAGMPDPLDGPTGPEVGPDPVVVMNFLAIGESDEGFDVDSDSPDGDPDPDNALSLLGSLANDALADALREGQVLLLLRFVGLERLPRAGELARADVEGLLGIDLDGDPSNNFDGDQAFTLDPASFDDEGEPLIRFPGVELVGEMDGSIRFRGGPASFGLALPFQGAELAVTVEPALVEGQIAQWDPQDGRIRVDAALIGGVVPASVLANPVEVDGTEVVPLSLLAPLVDVDLNGDGMLDKTANPENPDGLSAGIRATAVPARIVDEAVPMPPVVTLDALPAEVGALELTVSGQVEDPDGDAAELLLTLELNGVGGSIANDAGRFEQLITLTPGANTLRVIAEDPTGLRGEASAEIALVDENPPTLLVDAPLPGELPSVQQQLVGMATDDIGIEAVAVLVNGELTLIPGDSLDAEGAFDVPLTLSLGPNTLEVTARDLAGNASETVVIEVDVLDLIAPQLAIESPEGEANATPVLVAGTARDNAGAEGIQLFLTIGEDGVETPLELVPVLADPLEGRFSFELDATLGDNPVSLRAVDAAGNSRDLDHVVVLRDDTPPVIELLAPEPTVDAPEQQLVFTVRDDFSVAGATVAVGAGSERPADFDADRGEYSSPVFLELGPNTVIVRAVDGSGNLGTLEGIITLEDQRPPTLELTAPSDGVETFELTILATGTAGDDLGLAAVSVDVGEQSVPAELPGDDGAFSVEVPLALGDNTLIASATDFGGNITSAAPVRVRRLDPDAVGAVRLQSATPALVVGTGDETLLTATVERLAGGLIADGTEVTFTVDGAVELSAPTALTAGGVAQVSLRELGSAGEALVAATAGDRSDSVTVSLSMPTAARVTLCAQDGFDGAGFEAQLGSSAQAAATFGAPAAGTSETAGLFAIGHAYNRGEWPTRVLAASSAAQQGPGELLQVTVPIQSGIASPSDFALENLRRSDAYGNVADAPDSVRVCTVENQLGDLPPVVRLERPPATVDVPALVLRGTVQDADLAGVTAVVSLGGVESPVDVTSGSFELPLTLLPGANVIELRATDAAGGVGRDQVTVTWLTPNDPPAISITAPGAAVSDADIELLGTVSDDAGAQQVEVSVRLLGGGAAVAASVDPQSGEFRTNLLLLPGANTLRVTATDSRGASTVLDHSVELVEPVTPPQVTIEAPTAGQVFDRPEISVRARIDEGGDPTRIETSLHLDGTPIDHRFSAFSRLLTADLDLPPGDHVLEVVATDLTGGEGRAEVSVRYQAPDPPPQIVLSAPQDGQRVGGTRIQVEGTVADDQPAATLGVQVTVNGGAPLDAAVDPTTGAFSVEASLQVGDNALEVSVTDSGGQVTTLTLNVEAVEAPVVVLNSLQIGDATQGFNVDERPASGLGDPDPDNALSALGGIANPELADAVNGQGSGDPLLLLFQFEGLVDLPGPNQSVVVDINGYLGLDTDMNAADNFSGSEGFDIDPQSLDPTGAPLVRFENVTITNDGFGRVSFSTFPSSPSTFSVTLSSITPPLDLSADPAYISGELEAFPGGGFALNNVLIGGVVPATVLTFPIDIGGVQIVPLTLLVGSVDVDLNDDGMLDTTDATANNPDGLSMGLTATGVPARLNP